jgi:2-(1,2-epoxy-1,2-dihydrophenyl)acetyl-CoA isomerase
MKFKHIILENEGPVSILTLNRPKRLNAVNEKMMQELISAMDMIEKKAASRVLIITGSGRAFSAGGDFSSAENGLKLTSKSAVQFHQGYRRYVISLISKIYDLRVPTIAMVNGAAIGFGFDLTLACDMRIGSVHSKFQVAWIKLGLIPAAGSTWLLPRLIGVGRAAELIFSARKVDAEEAEQMGILNRLAPPSELRDETMQLALVIAQNPKEAVRLTKLNFNMGLECGLTPTLELLGASQTIALSTKDHEKALSAFRREPKSI